MDDYAVTKIMDSLAHESLYSDAVRQAVGICCAPRVVREHGCSLKGACVVMLVSRLNMSRESASRWLCRAASAYTKALAQQYLGYASENRGRIIDNLHELYIMQDLGCPGANEALAAWLAKSAEGTRRAEAMMVASGYDPADWLLPF